MSDLFGWVGTHDAQRIAATIVAACTALLAIVAVYRLPFVARPVRWLGRTLVGEPLTRFFHGVLDSWAKKELEPRFTKIEAQLIPNGGSSMRDVVDRIETNQGEHPQ